MENVDYVVTANGKQLFNGTEQSGSSISKSVQLPCSGEYNFNVTVSNAKGESPMATLKQWIGFDEPERVGNPTAKLENGIVTIKWSAPTTGTHQGTLGALTMMLFVYKDEIQPM